MNIKEEFSRNEIEKEDWKKAPGVIPEGTNSALAPRDYSIPCVHNLITVIKGYWIWWCSSHHQPFYLCDDKSGEVAQKSTQNTPQGGDEHE